MMGFLRLLLACLFLLPVLAQASTIRLKDLVEFDGVRGNDLVGYGLVVGLAGTGDVQEWTLDDQGRFATS